MGEQARQALRAARARDQPEKNLRQADLRVWRAEPKIARERDLRARHRGPGRRCAATYVFGLFSMAATTSRTLLLSALGPLMKSLMSAPPLKKPPEPVITIALMGVVGFGRLDLSQERARGSERQRVHRRVRQREQPHGRHGFRPGRASSEGPGSLTFTSPVKIGAACPQMAPGPALAGPSRHVTIRGRQKMFLGSRCSGRYSSPGGPGNFYETDISRSFSARDTC